MYKLNQIRDIHLEITSKCQAGCPMCPRRINGGILNPLLSLNEITLKQFVDWFPVEFIKQLDNLFMCGNLGDPIIAQDCLKIFQYLRKTNSNIRLSMHTNGSARSKDFWQGLAKANVQVTFGIDGLVDTHSLYRIGTDFDKIISNATDFIQAGGTAEWHMLVFKHNEHQITDCKDLSIELKFKKFTIKHTSRFKDGKFNVIDDRGKTTHILYPTTKSESMIDKIKTAQNESLPTISCKAKRDHQIYVGASGNVSPCCWLDLEWLPPQSFSRIDYMDKIDHFPNLKNNTLKEIFESNHFEKISSCWNTTGLKECGKQCGSFDKLGEQYIK
jgi:MoaA/NifB/PqqE/SkfB family radical SAM enzyme